MSIGRGLLSDCMQMVVLDRTPNEWIPVASGVPQGLVLGPLVFVPYTSVMFYLVENTLFANAGDSALLPSSSLG